MVWAGNNFLPDRGAFPAAQFLNLTGNTSLVSLPALMKRAEWVISNDSGPMHLAAALGVRVFAIFGPDRPAALRARIRVGGPDNFVIQAPVGRPEAPLGRADVYARFQRIDGAVDEPGRAPADTGSISMLDPKLVRESPDLVRAAIAKKHLNVDLDAVLGADAGLARRSSRRSSSFAPSRRPPTPRWPRSPRARRSSSPRSRR